MLKLIRLLELIGVLQRGDNYHIKMLRPPNKPEDWARFTQYARRVRTLRCTNVGPHILDVLGMHCPAQVVFPKMISLRTNRAKDRPPHPFFLAGPQLTACQLTYQITLDGPFLECLSNNCSTLKKLHISVYAPAASIAFHDVGALIGSSSLTYLHLDLSLSATSLRSLGALPQLRVLKVRFDVDGGPADLVGHSGFLSLHTLWILSIPHNAQHLPGAFIRSIRGAPLHEVCYSEEVRMSAFILRDFLCALEPHISLEAIGIIAERCTHMDEVVMTASMLHPLAQLRRLRVLSISGVDVSFSYSDIQQFGTQWPQLETLTVTPVVNETSALLDITVLAVFASHFPNLVDLTFPFDAEMDISNEVDIPDNGTSANVRATKMRSLTLPSWCPVATNASLAAEVAEYIFELFPFVTLDTSCMDYEESSYTNPYYPMWKLVQSLLPIFAGIRERTVEKLDRSVARIWCVTRSIVQVCFAHSSTTSTLQSATTDSCTP